MNTLATILQAIWDEFIYQLWPFRIIMQWEQGVRLTLGKIDMTPLTLPRRTGIPCPGIWQLPRWHHCAW